MEIFWRNAVGTEGTEPEAAKLRARIEAERAQLVLEQRQAAAEEAAMPTRQQLVLEQLQVAVALSMCHLLTAHCPLSAVLCPILSTYASAYR